MAKAERIDQRLMQEGRRTRGALYFGIGLGLAAGLLIILQAFILAHIINGVSFQGLSLAAVMPLLWALLGLFVLRAALSWAGELVAFRASARIKTYLREQLLKHLLQLGPVAIAGERSADIASTMIEGVEALEPYFSRYLPQMALVSLIPLAILIVVFPEDWISGLILLITGPLVPFFMVLVGYAAEAVNQRQWRKMLLMSAHFLDVVQGLTTLKIFGRAKDEIEIVARISDDYRRSTMAGLRVAFLTSAVLEFFASLSIALVAVSLGARLLQVHASVTFFTAFFVLLLAPEYFNPLRGLSTHYHARMSAIAAAKRIFEILDMPLPEKSRQGADYVPSGQISLSVRNLHFSYEAGRSALDGVNAEFPAGKVTALVGASGAGKSTLASALLGFVQASEGEILVNGQMPLNAIEPELWWKQLAWVPQNPRLFHGSLGDNIRIGRPDADLAALREAAQNAHALEFIENLPDGFETMIGDLGQGLSGGQIQRIALARAFLKNPPLFILDEATANLDMENESLVLDAMQKLITGRTAIVIAHRLATAERADHIIVMDAGRVAESGSHQELLAAGGVYARMVAAYRGETHV
ncbi:thiol reductant ABC exporter subunit CydD [Acidithiobacillus thiooxidans]|uniref:Thiol reductant ABC exporter subunit CydD n=3 Tax=Acidithiobacillaceae TaxID=225058 RepID=A0A1C2JIX4_ACITH|nr:thiol reductant ABC exporter subunit CydD [Acidithiobacillus thiooxidans]MBU2741123.1 thiol reductant ABC exporter subunit CydD [Acidithiobacillus albertensis]MBU2794276.1 thiol reductant ABC exporter subunit CydD [Acidithiobacillus thiooxidans]MBU2835795.1 thiol reductant ABC exporter subunit CydD [Acidithiobacillus thiooxidans]MBU2839761.1 thiol reductant ABC exporter subunit CydD [Acidithiobacillus thiooxidans]OCX67416.1 thiol reductant ABC exporter subunit CydD [Acidithiobacillus thioox